VGTKASISGEENFTCVVIELHESLCLNRAQVGIVKQAGDPRHFLIHEINRRLVQKVLAKDKESAEGHHILGGMLLGCIRVIVPILLENLRTRTHTRTHTYT